MNIQSCEHPRRIFNPYSKEFMYVPCGKCVTCRNRRSFNWVTRIKQENLCWKYCIFFTLTYNECSVPSLEPCAPEFNDGLTVFKGVRTPYSLSCQDIDAFTDDSRAYLDRIDKLRVLNKKDVQDFIKRLRRHIQYETKRDITLRYFVCGEYGETTLRPHYHGLLWFSDAWLFRNIERLLLKSWSFFDRSEKKFFPLGIIDCQPACNAASYVAAYINSYSNLPQVLSHTKVRPFHLSSRCPSIGSLLESDKQVQALFDSSAVFRSVSDGKGKFVSVPLGSVLEYRLFPKCPRFGSVSPAVRIALYRSCQRFGSKRTGEKVLDFARRWLSECKRAFDACPCYSEFLAVIQDLTSDFLDIRPIVRLLYISRKVVLQSQVFGVSVEAYVSRIVRHYEFKESLLLSSWYRFAERYSKDYGYFDLVSSDCDFVDDLFRGFVSDLKLKFYGLDSFSSFERFDYRNTHDYRSMVLQNQRIYKENTKTKKKNDYLNAHPEKRTFVYG